MTLCTPLSIRMQTAASTSSSTKGDARTMQTIHVTEAAHWSLVNEALGGFHDGVVRHLLLESSDCVGRDLNAVLKGRQTASVLVQFQWRKVPAAHLLFTDVRCVSFDYRRDVAPVVTEPSSTGGWKVFYAGKAKVNAHSTVKPRGTVYGESVSGGSGKFKGTLDYRHLLSVPRQPPRLEGTLELKLEF
jgi:hypothetical protein